MGPRWQKRSPADIMGVLPVAGFKKRAISPKIKSPDSRSASHWKLVPLTTRHRFLDLEGFARIAGKTREKTGIDRSVNFECGRAPRLERHALGQVTARSMAIAN